MPAMFIKNSPNKNIWILQKLILDEFIWREVINV